MAGTLKTTTAAMGQMNKVMDPGKMNKTLQDFSKESMKMGMTDEMSTKRNHLLKYFKLENLSLGQRSARFNFNISVTDTMDDIFDESDDEKEQDQIVNQILDEIGIEIAGKVRCFVKILPWNISARLL